MNAWCIRRKRGDDRLRRLAAAFVPDFLAEWVLRPVDLAVGDCEGEDWAGEDCAAAKCGAEIKCKHRTAAIREILLRTDAKR